MITERDVVALAQLDPTVDDIRQYVTLEAQILACSIACEPGPAPSDDGGPIDAAVTGFTIGFWLGLQAGVGR